MKRWSKDMVLEGVQEENRGKTWSHDALYLRGLGGLQECSIGNELAGIIREVEVVFFLMRNSPASEFYMPTFRNTLVHLAYEDGTDSVPKRRHIKFRRRGITQKKA
jgi:hypothetical protein